MADKNLARMIYDMAKADTDLSGDLKQVYKNKIRIDRNKQRVDLETFVKDYIIKNSQPIHNYVVLGTDSNLEGTWVKFIKYSASQITDTKIKELNDNIYVCYKYGTYYEITNAETKNLIKYGILPLDFEWTLTDNYDSIVISWRHWNIDDNI
jgi:hypothetical protein